MNSILSIILVIAMLFSSVGGLTSKIEDTVSADVKISLEAQAVEAIAALSGTQTTEESMQTLKMAADILSVLTLKGVASKDAAELVLLAGEDALISIGATSTEEITAVASNLLGSQVVTVSNATLEQMKQSGTDMSALEKLQAVNREQIMKDAAEARETLKKALAAKKGEAETGEFDVDGMHFTSRAPLDITYTEFMELLLNASKELAAKESMQAVAKMSGKDLVAEIEKSIEELKNRPEEQKPVVEEAFCYSDANNSEYFTCLMKNKAVAEGTAEETFNFAFGDVDGLLESNFHYVRGEQVIDARITSTDIDFINMEVSIATEQADALITAARETDGSLGMTADIKAKTQNVNAKIELNTKALGGDRYGFKVEMFMGGETPLLIAEGSYGKGGELTSVFSGEDITVVSLEEAMSDTTGEATNKLQMSMIACLMKGVATLVKVLPEDTSKWLSTQFTQMMTPQKTTTTP